MPVVAELFEKKATTKIVPNLFGDDRAVKVVPDLFEGEAPKVVPDLFPPEPKLAIPKIPDIIPKAKLALGVAKAAVPELIKAGREEIPYEEAQPAFKWAVSGMPTDLESIERIEKSSWADVIRESYPQLKDPESRIARSTAMQFGAELGGHLLDIGTRPSTYVLWGALERFVPFALRTAFKKLPKGTQEYLLKERFVWGRQPVDLAYKELSRLSGVELTAESTDDVITSAWKKAAFKWHPDKAPAGQAIRHTRSFIRAQGALDKIKSSRAIQTEAAGIIRKPLIEAPPEAVAPPPEVAPIVKPPIVVPEVPPRAITPAPLRGLEPTLAPPVKVPPPKPEVAKPPIVEGMATREQKAEAHILGRKMKLITTTKAGKTSLNRYRRLAEGMTGKRSIKDMTVEEADDFISAMTQVIERRPWEPPIIPISKKVVPKEFFDIQFKEPGIAKVGTPKEYYQRLMGTEPLLRPVVEAHKAKYLELQNINRWIDSVTRTISKQATAKEKVVAGLLRKPVSPIVKMRDLLDTYKTTPDFLSEQDKKIFTEIRAFTKSMLDRTNEMRARLGLEPIREVKAYITHYLDDLARQIVQKKYPFPEDVKYWLGRNMPAKIYNPTAMERRVRDELNTFFSKDLGRLLKTLAKFDLRDIYLSQPYSVMKAQLNALGDKIPASVRKEMDDFLRYDIFNHPTELDRMINASVEKPTEIINNLLRPLNRIIGNPIASISRATRRLVMGATIWGRPRLAIRNMLTQKLLTINIYGLKPYLKAQFWKTPEGVMDKIRSTQFYKLSRRFEDIPVGLMKVETAGMLPYQKSHAGINYLSNVDVAMKAGYYYGEDMVRLSRNTKSAFYKRAVRVSQKENIPLEKLLWNESDILAEAVEAGSLTQWLYFATDMPYLYRGHAQRGVLTLQSWWQNYFFKHWREVISRTVSSKTSRGKLIRPSDRINWMKGLIVISGVLEGLRQAMGLDYARFLLLWGPLPAYLSPPAQVLLGTYNYLTADSDWKRQRAVSQMRYSYRAFIPGSMAWRDLIRFMKAEISLKEFLFYTEKKEKPSFPPIPKIKPLKGLR